MTAINAKMVDDYFGIGTFGAFQYQREVGKRLTAHYERRLKQAFSPNDDGLSFRLDDIGYIGASVEIAFEHVSAAKKINENQFWPVYQLYEAAVACAQAESDHLDAVFAAGFLPMLRNLVKQFPHRELKSAAEAERKALLELDNQLDKAKSGRRGAIFDKVLDIGQLLVPFAKEVDLAMQAGVALGGLIIDDSIGPGQPSQGKIARTTAATFGEPLAKLAELSATMTKVVKTGGVLNGLYDAFGDWSEVKQAFGNVDKIREAIETEKKWRKYIIETIWENWRDRVFNVQNQLARVKKSLDESARGVEDQRTDYWNLQQKSGYKRYLIWKIDR